MEKVIKDLFIFIIFFITLFLAGKTIKYHKSKILNDFIKIVLILIFGIFYIKL